MKQLTCEMCGSTNLIKEDGMYVCQNCGTKYSVEEARKMMVEGVVEVTGTVKIDETESYQTNLELAQDAFKDNRYDSAYDHSTQALRIQPKNIELIAIQGLSVLGKERIVSRIPTACTNSMERVFSLIEAINDSDIKLKTLSTISTYISTVCQYKISEIKVDIQDLELQKETTRGAGEILGDLFVAQFVAQQNQRDDKIKANHNSQIEAQIKPLRTAISLVKDFKTTYDKKIKDAQLNEAINDSKSESITELIDNAFNNLQSSPVASIARYEQLIKKLPDEWIGYVGKSVAAIISNKNISANELFAPIIGAKQKKVSAEYKTATLKLVNYAVNDEKDSLLIFACNDYNLPAVRALISIGADINYKDNYNATALWLITFRKLPPDKTAAGREIARLLLERGASVNVTNKGGIALYNKDTDPEIAKMIKSKHPEVQKGPAAKNIGCYVATCVYGSYDCPEVWTLRRYRDYQLAKTRHGRAFIHTYYAIAPTAVKLFGKTKWFNKFFKKKLDKKVKRLNEQGVKNTPYQDLDW